MSEDKQREDASRRFRQRGKRKPKVEVQQRLCISILTYQLKNR